MRPFDDKVIFDAVQFAARWGFLSKGLFFKYICLKSEPRQFFYWNHLIDQGYFEKSKVNSNVLYLKTNKKVKSLTSYKSGARFHLYVDHDILVADCLFEFQRSNLVGNYKLENQLKENVLLAYSSLGGDHLGRYPDALFQTNETKKTVAFEVEKTVKTYLRLNRMLLNYSFYEKVDSVLFAVVDESIGKAIKNVFFDSSAAVNKDIGVFLLDEFKDLKMDTVVESRKGKVLLREFLK